jgi:DNA-binding NtrC family response regulator
VDHFLHWTPEKSGASGKTIDPEALEILTQRDWAENNVRELRNTVELAMDFSPDGTITSKIVERVFRVQRGELDHFAEESRKTDSRDSTEDNASGGLVEIRHGAFRELLGRSGEKSGTEKARKEDTPFYRIQLEVAAQAIIEGLRATNWKLRPAARLLGISPTKLRSEFKQFLEQTLARHDGKLDQAAGTLQIPVRVLARKASDLGLG